MTKEVVISKINDSQAVAFVKAHWLPFVLALTVLTRLPFLWTGYGSDVDAWLVARSALNLWHTGIYNESRLPGYPLHEIVSAPLVALGGAPLSNAATLAITLIAILIWSKLAQRIGNHHTLLVVAFAFAPVVWQHSAVTLDYMWSLSFMLISVYLLINQRALLSGLALGIATGFRPSNLVAFFPILCLAYLEKSNVKQMVVFTISAFGASLVSFTPLLLKYGITGWFAATQLEMSDVVHPTPGIRWMSFFYRSIYFIGPVTALVASYVLWKGKDALLSSIHMHDSIVITSVVGIATFWLLFLWLPLDRAYLLPALPFLLLLVDRASSSQAFAVFTTCLVLSALVTFDVVDGQDRRSFGPNIHAGMVIEEIQIRESLIPWHAQENK